jgi:phage gp29-like protein
MSLSALPPMRVPTLTEVVEWPPLVLADSPPPSAPDAPELPVLSEAVLPADWPDAETESSPIVEAELTQRILTDLQRQVDLALEDRLQAVVAPMLARLVQALLQEARDELALTLRDVVAEAVSQELMRHRSELDRLEPH